MIITFASHTHNHFAQYMQRWKHTHTRRSEANSRECELVLLFEYNYPQNTLHTPEKCNEDELCTFYTIRVFEWSFSRRTTNKYLIYNLLNDVRNKHIYTFWKYAFYRAASAMISCCAHTHIWHTCFPIHLNVLLLHPRVRAEKIPIFFHGDACAWTASRVGSIGIQTTTTTNSSRWVSGKCSQNARIE